MQPEISVVSPIYQCEDLLEEFLTRLTSNLETLGVRYEIVLIEDRSPDGSWEKLKSLQTTVSGLRAFRLSRNFGQHRAITAGLDHARGEWVVVMDCDLQDRPEEIQALYKKAKQGYDLVLASREERTDSWPVRLFSRLFYAILSYFTGTKVSNQVANFGIYHRRVVNAICSMRETIRYFPTMAKWVGFHSTTLPVKHGTRPRGKSSYNFRRRLHLGMDILLAYSDRPLKIFVKLGTFISLTAFAYAVVVFVRALVGDITVSGYASILISIWFFGGLSLLTLGVVGLYVGKIFEGVKARPIYLIDTELEND